MHVNLQRETTVFMLQNCLAWTQVLICGWPFSAAISATPLSLSQLVSCGGGGAAGGPTEGGGGVTPSFSSPMPLPSSPDDAEAAVRGHNHVLSGGAILRVGEVDLSDSSLTCRRGDAPRHLDAAFRAESEASVVQRDGKYGCGCGCMRWSALGAGWREAPLPGKR